jgi:hypothetical protein
MGSIYSYFYAQPEQPPQEQISTKPVARPVQEVDMIKSRLKLVRDKLQTYIHSKEK